MKKILMVFLIVGFILAINGNLLAGPVTTEGQWYEFHFYPDGVVTTCVGFGCSPSSGGNSVFADDPPWTFSSPYQVSLTVTDAFLYGDAFEVYDLGALIGSTPAVAIAGSSGLSDPELALLDPGLSHASFLLAPGAHSITLFAYQTVSDGAAFFRADSVPEPSTILLVGFGLAGVGLLRRRFKN